MKLKHAPTGRLIERFSSLERIAHWSTAISFVILALSGLTILFGKFVLLPVIGYTLFAWLSPRWPRTCTTSSARSSSSACC